MPFICPECKRTSLSITDRLELPADSRSDEITLQIVACASCSFKGIAVYEESRRGALDDESVDHAGYAVNQGDLTRLRRLIRACPDRGNPRCRCETHRQLGRRDRGARWSGLDEVALGDRFPMRLR